MRPISGHEDRSLLSMKMLPQKGPELLPTWI